MSYYEQNRNVIRLHNLPRFGHSNQLSSLVHEDENDDYIDGLKAFSIFFFCCFFVWGLIVVLLKWIGGPIRVGCAAGGELVDVKALREQGVRRWERRARIIRSLRVRNIFLICSIGLIAFSFVFANQGLTPFIDSLEDVLTVSSLTQTRVQHGIHLAHLLSTHVKSIRPYLDLNITKLCPSYEQTILESQFSLAITAEEVVSTGKEMEYFFEKDMDSFLNGIGKVADTCESVDEAVLKVKENEWIFLVFLIATNAINIFFILGVVLTQNKINWDFYQSLLGGIFVPAFAATMVIAVVVLCMVAVGGMINADFCSGGQGSPLGTLVELVSVSGYKRDGFINLVLEYYTTQKCEGPNPFIFIQDLDSALVETSGRVNELSQTFQNADVVSLSQQCGANFQLVQRTFDEMAPILADLSQVVGKLHDLSHCEQISPILEDLTNGPICNETVNTLSWMYYTLLVIALLIMMMLSTRAALFNTIIPGSKKKRREKEFRQYKQFMQEFGFNTKNWQMDPPKKVDSCHMDIVHTDTYDTDETGSLSPRATEENEHIFDDEPMSEEAIEQAPTMFDVLQKNSNELSDDDSFISVDSDDSSLNPPPSIIHSVASSLTVSVSSALSRFQAWTYPSSVNMTFDTIDHDRQHRRAFDTPTKYPTHILGLMKDSQDNSEDQGDQEIVPLSPSVQPVAPKKSQKALRRTRGSTALS